MDIIINSLYQDKDVFLRELVSNAADACDKKRFRSLNSLGQQPELKIKVKGNHINNTLTIEDSGIGMTKDELVNNLGNIAQSGTRNFMNFIKEHKKKNKQENNKQDDISLIGQFGVGFYSGYLVADKITVISKSINASDEQWRWESSAGNSFTIYNDRLSKDYIPIEGSGTRIILNLKEECDEYSGEFKLKDMLKRYSSFITFPIELWSEKTDFQAEEDESNNSTEDAMKSVPVKTQFWDRINSQSPIWTRSPKEVNESEYHEFYKSTFKAYDEPAAYTHFSLEGQVDFTSLLYIPSVLPYELTKDMFSEQSRSMKLYVKRVFINDKFEELLPRWLTFVRGLVDSEDLPLNVGREILQKSKMLAVIKKRLVRKVIDMIFSIEKQGHEKYMKFWNIFGKYVKVGMIEDEAHKDELAKVMRVWTSNSNDHLVSLDSYIDRMKTNQTKIYYVTGDNKAVASRSPVLEQLNARDIEVVYLVEPLDELVFQSLVKYKDHLLVDVAKGSLELDEMDGIDTKKKKQESYVEYQQLCDWLKDKVSQGELSKVDISTRLTTSPAALVQGAYGMSPTMQRYMRAQAAAAGREGGTVSDRMDNLNKVTLEINPTHPIIIKLNRMVSLEPESKATLEYAKLLYEVTSLASGYSLSEPNAFAQRVNKMMESMPSEGSSGTDKVENIENVEAEVVE
jgi:heat shock protein beta